MSSEIKFGRAINQALRECMAADDAVIVIGEDIAGAGGSFGVTRGLLNEFGEHRVRDTPISEAAIVGAAVGAAMCGLRPVVEIMFMDFVTLAMDALVNQAAKMRFMFGGRASAPLVLRTPHGGGLSAGPQHSQCLEAWFAHVPGLKTVCPSTPADAYHLMKAAVADPDPVIFIENKSLYGASGPAPQAENAVAIGEAKTLRAGTDLTILAYGAVCRDALKAAEMLASEGVSAEVIDLRSLQPWDKDAVLASVARTHRLVVVHEAVRDFGPAAEICAHVAEFGFFDLDAPPERVAAPFMPPPFAPDLERVFRPNAEAIIEAARRSVS